MKFIPKLLTALFLIVFIVELFGFLFILLAPNLSQAAEQVNFVPQVGIGGEFQKSASVLISPTSIGEYIREIYKYAIGAVGILAAVVLMIGGIIWLTSGGNQTRVGEAKSWIGASLTGLIIALCSYLILATINPELVKIKPISPKEVTNNNANDTAADIDGCCVICNGMASCSCSRTKQSSCDTKQVGNKWLGVDKAACASSCTMSFWDSNFQDQNAKTCIKSGMSCGDGGLINATTKNDLCCSGDCLWGMLNNSCK
jgi:hypothetical protein